MLSTSRFVKEKGPNAGDNVSFYIDSKVRNRLGTDKNVESDLHPVQPAEMVRLFGVNLFRVAEAEVGNFGKRTRKMEIIEIANNSKISRVSDALQY